MRSSLLLWALLVSAGCACASPDEQFVLQNYRLPDGAVVLEINGNYVEPYFATKALLVAQDAGLDVRQPADAWIKWALAHERPDGRFDRYCHTPGGDWRSCGPADADDAMLALWLQLLYRCAPDSGLPLQWRESAARSRSQLTKLWNGRLKIYHISKRNHAALLMDNVEIYSALKDIAAAEDRFGDKQTAESTSRQAEALASGIREVFWDGRHHWFRSSMQKDKPAFYPDVVGQVYPWLADLPVPEDPRAAWKSWRERFGSAWLATKYDPYPWGLVALAAAKEGDDNTAVCWLARSQSLRYGVHWNVLEEAAYEGLARSLGGERVVSGAACSGMPAR
jgi:hypothetical protein